jgi:DnaK suppressor protein
MKTVVTSAKKSTKAKKPALTAAAKKLASPAKASPQKASRSSSKVSTEKPASKTQSKQVKAQAKPAGSKPVSEPASKFAARPAPKAGKTSGEIAGEIKAVATTQKKETKKPTLPKADKSIGKESTKTAAPRSDRASAVADNKNSISPQSGKNLSSSKAETGLKGRIAQPVVSKVSEVATNTIKSTPPAAGDQALLTEEQILKMREEDYMNPAQLAFFKARLQQLEKDLLKNADETTEHLRETVLVPDPADRATIEEEHALELRTRDRERKLLKKVQQSLASIESGDYGWCEETGEPIGIPRLLARPTATLSLEAQQRRELKQKLYGD